MTRTKHMEPESRQRPEDRGKASSPSQAPEASRAPRAITFQPGIYDCVLEVLPEDRRVRLLDAGAGEGFFTRKLLDAGYENVEATDYVAEAFRCPDIPFTQANLSESLPFPDDHFDCVVSVEVIEHIENHFAFVAELIRVTKPGGQIVITTPNVMSLSSRLHLFVYGYTDCAPLPLQPGLEDWFMQHVNPIGVPMLLFHFQRNGAEMVDLRSNRIRAGSRVMAPFLRPLMRWCLKRKLLRDEHSAHRELFEEHMRWVLSDANLLGRITIAIARKRS